MSAADGRLWSIQYLRFVAAFGVVLFHACSGTAHPFAIGAIGVHLFFVISGFLMWRVTALEPQAPRVFWLHRARRIIPLYWAAIALMVVLVHALKVRPWEATDQAGPVLKSMLFIPYRAADGVVAPVVYPGWTLNYEAFFYLVFGLSLFLAPLARLGLLS